MIFVTLGTHELPFTRLLEYLEKTNIEEEVLIQSGNTEFKSKKYKIVKFMSEIEFNSAIEKAELIICHGGVGTILSALKKEKKIITVPRLSKYNEHNDDHQIEITNKFSKLNYIVNCINLEELQNALRNHKYIGTEKYESKNKLLIDYIDNYIKNIV